MSEDTYKVPGTGWRCVKCDASYAPHVSECHRCNSGLAPQPVYIPIYPQPYFPYPWWPTITWTVNT